MSGSFRQLGHYRFHDFIVGNLRFVEIQGRSYNVLMEQVLIILAVLAIAYHVVSSARRQIAIRDYLEEQTGLLRAVFPRVLALNGDLAGVTRIIEGVERSISTSLERLERGLLGGVIRVAEEGDGVRYASVTGELEKASQLLSDILYEIKVHLR